MHHKFLPERNEFSKSEPKRLNPQEKPSSIKQVSYEQSERYKAGAIQSIIDESESLKYALTSAIKKKEEMYKVLLQYKDALDSANQKIRDLENHLNEVDQVKHEVEKVRKQLIKRDEKIKSLHNRNKTLEALLEQQENDQIYLKSISFKKTADQSKVLLSLSLEGLVQKVKSNPIFHKIFKGVCPCLNSFLDLANQKKTEEVCLKLYKFSCELMKEIEKNCLRRSSPLLNDLLQSHQTLSSYQSAINPSFVNSIDEEYYSKNDEERIEKLNLELKTIMAKSKEVLSNRSFSVNLKNNKLESSFSPLQTQNLPSEMKSMGKIIDTTKDSLQDIIEVQPKSTKSIARRIPKVEIIGKPGNRSAKIIPKSSILKKK